jgi:hypothetical protein
MSSLVPGCSGRYRVFSPLPATLRCGTVDDVIFNLARRGRDTDVVVGAAFFLDDAFVTPARAAVIRALDKARLIVLDADPRTQRRMARVAHEALLTHWRRARALRSC